MGLTAQIGGSLGQVAAGLNHYPFGAGTATNLGSLFATSSTRAEANLSVSHVFDFDANYYWVVITLYRPTTSYNPVFWGINLKSPILC